jgi:hypothetical protein
MSIWAPPTEARSIEAIFRGEPRPLPSNQDPVELRLEGLLLQWSREKEHFHKDMKEVHQKQNGTPKINKVNVVKLHNKIESFLREQGGKR